MPTEAKWGAERDELRKESEAPWRLIDLDAAVNLAGEETKKPYLTEKCAERRFVIWFEPILLLAVARHSRGPPSTTSHLVSSFMANTGSRLVLCSSLVRRRSTAYCPPEAFEFQARIAD